MAMVAAVVALAVIQIAYEDVLVFLGATSGGSASLPPMVLVGVPLVLFVLLAGVLLGWAILTDEGLR